MRLEVAGFFDDRSTDRLGMEADAALIGPLGDLGAYVKEHRTDVIFIALPIRHVKRVMNLLDDLRDTTASIYYVPDIFVFDLIQARSGRDSRHSRWWRCARRRSTATAASPSG